MSSGQPSHRGGGKVATEIEQEQKQEQKQEQGCVEEQGVGLEQGCVEDQKQGEVEEQKQGVGLEEDLDRQITDVHIDQISRSLDCGWRSLPRPLEMENIVVNDLDRELCKEEDKRRGFFYKWKQMMGRDATYKRLIDALVEIGHIDDANKVYKMLGSHEKTSNHAYPCK